MDTYFNAYKGSEPYAFVSYSHADSKMVYPILKELYDENYRIWYDEGIAPSAEWRGVINEHIRDCSVFMIFVTRNSMDSHEVIKECTYAINLRKKLHIIYLENVSDGMISPNLIADFTNSQRVHAYEMHSDVFAKRLREPLAGCRETAEAEKPVQNEETPEKKTATVIAEHGETVFLKAWKSAKPSFATALLRMILLVASMLILPLYMILWGGEKSSSASGMAGVIYFVGIICLIPLIMWVKKTKYGRKAVLSNDMLQSGFVSEIVWTAISRLILSLWAMLLYTIGATVFMYADAWFSDTWPIFLITILTDFASIIFSVTPRFMLNSMLKGKKEVRKDPIVWHKIFQWLEIMNILKAVYIAICCCVILGASADDRMFAAYGENIYSVLYGIWCETWVAMMAALFTVAARVIMFFHERAVLGLGKALADEK